MKVVLIVKGGTDPRCTLIRVEVVLILKGGAGPVYPHQSESCINSKKGPLSCLLSSEWKFY